MRHIFYDSLKGFFVALVATLAFVAPTFAANLPSGYTELEYIEGTGTQWIDTGIKANLNTVAWADFQYTDTDEYGAIFGVTTTGDNNQSFFVRPNTAKTALYANFDSVARTIINQPVYDTNRHSTQLGNSEWLVDNVLCATWENPTSFTSSENIKLFKYNTTAAEPAKLKMFGFKLWDGNGLIRNFVPAKNSSGVIGMYDTVRNEFYTNQGTGTFTAGPVVLNPCRNLADMTTSNIDIGHYISSAGAYLESTSNFIYAPFISVQPNTTYTLSWGNIELYYVTISEYSTANNAGFVVRNTGTTGGNYKLTITTGATTHYVRFGSNPYGNSNTVTLTQIQELNWQFEEGSTATAYVPYCATDGAIKIATTKYTEDAFAGLMTTLSEAITKVTNIVDTTVQQATEIGNLATTKQDRPDTDCPAGRKCLLIMGADNKPHWYLIQE